MRRIPKFLELNALSITFFYLVLALLWILLSDQFLIWITNDPQLISKYQTLKGIFYVLLTSIFLFLLISKSQSGIRGEKYILDKSLEAAGMAAWRMNIKTETASPTRADYRLLGLKKPPNNWTLQNFFESIHPEDVERVKKHYYDTVKNETPYNIDYRIVWPDESIHWMRSRGSLVYNDFGKATHLSGVVTDITEQKLFEEEYYKEKELFEGIFENIPVMVDIYDPGVNKIRVNKSFEEIMGWTNQEIQNIDLMAECYPEPEERNRALQAMQNANGDWHEFTVRTKSGENRIQSWSNIQLSDDTTIGIGLDITELKTSQAEIYESRELLKRTFESLKESVIILNPKTRLITDCNKSTHDLFGYTSEELIGNSTKILHVDEEHFIRFGEIGTVDLQNNGFFKTEFVMKRKDGSQFYSDHTVTIVKNEKGETEKIVSVIRDITEKKKHEKELKKLADRYRRAEEIAGFGHWKRNIKTDEAIWSDGFYEIIGLEKGEKEPSYENLLEMIHPDDRKKFDSAFKEALETGSLNVRYRLIKPSNGEVGYYHELAQTSYDEDGNAEYISGTIQDMTQLEEFQIKLKQRNDFIETTLENLPIGVAVNLIESGEATLMNSKFSEIYGWPKETINNVETFFEKVYPDESYRTKIVEMINADIASKNPERMQWNGIKIITQHGEERIINAKNIPVYDQNLMISTVVDVTAQFQAEKRLAESEHNYRLLFQKSPLPMWIYDPQSLRIIEVNNAAIKHYGYTRKEFAELTLLDIRPESERERLKKLVSEENFSSLVGESGEWQHLKKTGELIYVNIAGSSINYFGNKYRLVLVNDITEQKKTEEKILASLVEGENKERARIARELHDGLGQYLAAANMNLDAIQNSVKNLSQRKQQQFEKGLNLLKQSIQETNQISKNLLPRVVDDYGLALAVEALVDNYSNQSNMNITYYENIEGLELPREVEFNLYRIAQEGISNAIKYSEASKVNVQLIKDELDLILTIDDNGIGFDESDTKFTPGLGLQTIKTRAGALGGEFEFDSRPGKGTFLNVIVPIRNNKK